jgi:HD-like signal output (HDOD) protein
MFGRFQLLRLLGKSERTMAWAVAQAGGPDLMIVLPRVQPVGAAALERWLQRVQRAARLQHPNLARPIDVGVQDGWPYAAYEMGELATLAERLTAKGLPAAEVAPLAEQALHGLAFAHEGGVVHHDIQPYLLVSLANGPLMLAGLEVAGDEAESETRGAGSVEPGALRAQRDAAQRDVLALGIVLHQMLAGTPALEEPDVGRVIGRLPPEGRDIVRLPWSTAHPVPEALRVIVNRATDRQERQRYRNARTLARALEGWIQAESGSGGGPLALLADKLRAAGALPSSPGAASQAAKLALMERERTNELAEVVLQDLALAFELLRAVNSAQVRGAQVAGSGPVLTLRRAIALLGLDGVRRAALALRPWPGPLDDAGAAELERQIARAKRAGRLALRLRPAAYDGEVVYLITLLQNLGRLVVQYHFADEAAQIRRLMQPGEPDEPGMSEEAASFAVLGADIEAIGGAVARHWGLDESVLQMIRRPAPTAPVRASDHDDDEMLRLVAAAANEAVDALALQSPQVAGALQRVVQRYGRVLEMTPKDLQGALQESQREGPLQLGAAAAREAPPPEPQPAPGGLRAALAARNTR